MSAGTALRLKDYRPATCPACGHVGMVARNVPGSAWLRCSGCKEKVRVRACVGERPCRFRKPSPQSAAKKAAARSVLAKYQHVTLNDDLSDLWPAHETVINRHLFQEKLSEAG